MSELVDGKRRLKLWMLRNVHGLAGLVLAHDHPVAGDLVDGHLPHVAGSLCGVEQEVEAKALF
ncbi:MULTISPECIES: hypothetical protein [Brevundimonas]|uniref:hypothetical protein n=1 Tax=Brevundimonas TaxID=41275 RepID=UPI00174A86B8|nr:MULTISPECIES: hypothetical protein [Brevundimonas]MCK6102908.1 hypothetical protein [Brevundimonas sp. EYE_349]